MQYIEEYPALVIIPGLALTAVVVSFNLLGEAFALQKVPRAVRGSFLSRKKAARAAEDAARAEG
jgi:peptide/nickel transport system permease protein